MLNEHSESRVFSVKQGDQIWCVHDWKKRGILQLTAHLVHDDHVKLGSKFRKLGKDFFLTEREAKTFVYEAARRSLSALDVSYKGKRKKLAETIAEMQVA